MANEYAFFYKSENGDRVYDDTSFEHWLKRFFTSGVFLNDLQVKANGDMTVTVGSGYVNADGKVKVYENETILSLNTAGGTYPRIDSIVLERNDAERDIILKVITGGYSSAPVAHTPVREDGIYQLVIAQILVGAGAVAITQANITDTRANTELCGIVASTVDQIDFGQVQAQFDDWFEYVKGQLNEDAAGNLLNQVDEIKTNLLYKPNLLLNGDFQVNQLGKTTYTNEPCVDKWVCGDGTTVEVVEDGIILKSSAEGATPTLTQTLTGQVENVRNSISISIDGVVHTYNVKVYQNLDMTHNVTDNVSVTINGQYVIIGLIGECLDTTINFIRVDKGEVAYPHCKEDYEVALTRCGKVTELAEPTFTIASERANIESGEKQETIFGKIAKWFSDLKAGAFSGVANNLTTTASGSVLDARQGKILNDKITSGYTKMTSSANGQITLPNGAKIVYGVVKTSTFSADQNVGGYSKSISLSDYGLKSPVFAQATGLYDNGLPAVSIKSLSTSALVLSAPVNIANCSVYWMVIG